MKVNLYFDEKKKIYKYFTENSVFCGKCDEEIFEQLIHSVTYGKKLFKQEIFCLNCYKKISNIGIVNELKLCVLIRDLEHNLIPIFNMPPELTNYKQRTTFYLSDVQNIINCSEGIVVDYTRLANRNESCFEIKQNILLLEKRDNELSDPLDDSALDNFLTIVKDSVPMIETTKKLEIEDGTKN